MKRPRLIPILVVSAALALVGASAKADVRAGIGVSISPHLGMGVWVGAPARRHVIVERPHRGGAFGRPWRHRFGRLGPPRHVPIVVPRPIVREVVIDRPYACDVAAGSITVWITNSNGSRTSIRLVREGPWYIGPRGEYYAGLPSNEQLRRAYGF